MLFNYKWLYAKMSALPLHEVLGDFEDAVQHIRDPVAIKADTINNWTYKKTPFVTSTDWMGLLCKFFSIQKRTAIKYSVV